MAIEHPQRITTAHSLPPWLSHQPTMPLNRARRKGFCSRMNWRADRWDSAQGRVGCSWQAKDSTDARHRAAGQRWGCPDAEGIRAHQRGMSGIASLGSAPGGSVDHQTVFMLILVRSQQIPGHHFPVLVPVRSPVWRSPPTIGRTPLPADPQQQPGLAQQTATRPSGREKRKVGIWAIRRAITCLGSAGWRRIRVVLRDNTTWRADLCKRIQPHLTEARMLVGVLCTEMTWLFLGPVGRCHR